jgi:hypothetical protein
MTEDEDWLAMRERYERFMETDLGKRYRAYDKAVIDYWRREATNAFVARLMDLAGI